MILFHKASQEQTSCSLSFEVSLQGIQRCHTSLRLLWYLSRKLKPCPWCWRRELMHTQQCSSERSRKLLLNIVKLGVTQHDPHRPGNGSRRVSSNAAKYSSRDVSATSRFSKLLFKNINDELEKSGIKLWPTSQAWSMEQNNKSIMELRQRKFLRIENEAQVPLKQQRVHMCTEQEQLVRKEMPNENLFGNK